MVAQRRSTSSLYKHDFDGLRVPCARWTAENLVLLMENYALECDLQKLHTEEVDWRTWAHENGFLS
jgi:hypothetical protein